MCHRTVMSLLQCCVQQSERPRTFTDSTHQYIPYEMLSFEFNHIHVYDNVVIMHVYSSRHSFAQLFYYYTLIIPNATSCKGIMFLTSVSVIQSVSPGLFVITTLLKPLNRILLNFVDMKDTMCRCTISQEILIILFSGELLTF